MTPTDTTDSRSAYDQYWAAVEDPTHETTPTHSDDAYAAFRTAADE